MGRGLTAGAGIGLHLPGRRSVRPRRRSGLPRGADGSRRRGYGGTRGTGMVPRPTGGGEGGRRPDRGGVGPEAWSGAELGVPPPSSGRVARR